MLELVLLLESEAVGDSLDGVDQLVGLVVVQEGLDFSLGSREAIGTFFVRGNLFKKKLTKIQGDTSGCGKPDVAPCSRPDICIWRMKLFVLAIERVLKTISLF